jgi:hypothetical protein
MMGRKCCAGLSNNFGAFFDASPSSNSGLFLAALQVGYPLLSFGVAQDRRMGFKGMSIVKKH